ncbi:hypothetical protein R7J21_19420, partial [Acinetobacter baumannii]|nr:hypothetical protein [Acinetobacter baumannii]MDW5298467.1 hypothetical protein [Acinetobacter baumannii]
EISNLLNELDQLQNTLLTKQSEENEVIIKENSLDNELPDSISDEEAERLKADLKRLNADPEWAGEDGLRYQAFFERINKALEGDSDAVVWAREWISDLDDQALAQQQA